MSEQYVKNEESALRLMRVLEVSPCGNQRDLAEQTGMSLGSLNYCLKALMAKGLVKMQNFAHSRNKLGYAYVLTPSGIAEKAAITHRFLQRKMHEYESLRAEIEALTDEVIKTDRSVEAKDKPARIEAAGKRL